MKTILILIFIPSMLLGQRWQDSNRGLYPQSVQASYNARNTAVGLRYGYLFQKQPLGLYTSFSNTIAPNPDYINYEWERKYSLGGMLTLPYVREMKGIHTFFTVGAVYNSHPTANTDKGLMPGQYDGELYYTTNWGCDIGFEWQIKHFKCHLTVDAINFMRYVEFGAGYTFYKLRK